MLESEPKEPWALSVWYCYVNYIQSTHWLRKPLLHLISGCWSVPMETRWAFSAIFMMLGNVVLVFFVLMAAWSVALDGLEVGGRGLNCLTCSTVSNKKCSNASEVIHTSRPCQPAETFCQVKKEDFSTISLNLDTKKLMEKNCQLHRLFWSFPCLPLLSQADKEVSVERTFDFAIDESKSGQKPLLFRSLKHDMKPSSPCEVIFPVKSSCWPHFFFS